MKVILTDRVEKLGEPGDVKEVANGYARNFLLPRGLAIPATTGALKEIENRKASVMRRQASEETQFRAQAERLNGLTVLLYARTGEQNRLYGSITSSDVAQALQVQHKMDIDRRRIKINSTIHRTGTYTATVNIGRNQNAQINLLVEPETNRTTGALTAVAAQAPVVEQPAAPAEVATTDAVVTDEADFTATDVSATNALSAAYVSAADEADFTVANDAAVSEFSIAEDIAAVTPEVEAPVAEAPATDGTVTFAPATSGETTEESGA